MQQAAVYQNYTDTDNNPAGGDFNSMGIAITWQRGPLGRGEARLEPNGAFVETVIFAALQRIEYYQSTKFECRENALAVTKLEEALHWLQARTADRERRRVEGTHKL